MNKAKAQKRLGTLWLLFALIFIILGAFLAIDNTPKIALKAYTGWIFPLFFPTASLIIAFFRDEKQREFAKQSVHKDTYRLSMIATSVYLLLVFILLITTFNNANLSSEDKIKKLQEFNLFLGPIQGIAVAFIVAFFASKGMEQKDQQSRTSTQAPKTRKP